MFLSRLVPVVELLVTGLLVYALAARLVGPAGGMFSAALWLLNPFVIGIGHLDGIDIPFTLDALTVALPGAVARGPYARAIGRWSALPAARRS